MPSPSRCSAAARRSSGCGSSRSATSPGSIGTSRCACWARSWCTFSCASRKALRESDMKPFPGNPKMLRPESSGLSGPRLQHIDRFIQQKYLDTGKLPCALTLVERNGQIAHLSALGRMDVERNRPLQEEDRKSTRLNSSHLGISYAVFCLKKK